MSDPGDYGSEMGNLNELSDRDIDGLFAGRTPRADEDLTELTTLIEGVRVTCIQSLDPEMEQRHLSAIVKAAHLTSTGARTTGAPAPNRSARRKSMLGALLAPLWAKIAVAALSAVAATSGLAAANVLPAPAQEAVANVAERLFGIDLPSEDDVATGDTESEGTGAEVAANDNGKPVNDDVKAVLEDDSLQGRDKGEAVADAADQNRQDGDKNPTGFGPDNHPSAPTDGEGGEEDQGSSNNPTGYGSDNHPTGRP